MNYSNTTPLRRHTNYAIHLVSLIAKSKPRMKVYSLHTLMGISESYIEQIIKRLAPAKILQGQRGPGGGYTLTDPTTYSIDDTGTQVCHYKVWTAWDVVEAIQPVADWEHDDDWTVQNVYVAIREALKKVRFKNENF